MENLHTPYNQENKLTNSLFPHNHYSSLEINPSPFNLSQLLTNHAQSNPSSVFIKYRTQNQKNIHSISYLEAQTIIQKIANFLINNSIKKNEILEYTTQRAEINNRVAIISQTRAEWALADIAIAAAEYTSVSVFQTLTAEEIAYLLWDSDSTIVFAENEEQLAKLQQIDGKEIEVPKVEWSNSTSATINLDIVITFEKIDNNELISHFQNRLFYWGDLVNSSQNADQNLPKTSIQNLVSSIVYTSGTTDAPKGVVQLHSNHIEMCRSVVRSGLVGNGKGVFLHLPLAHSFAKVVFYVVMYSGGDITFPTVASTKNSKIIPELIFKDIKSCAPKIFPSVPRIYEKLAQSITSKISSGPMSIFKLFMKIGKDEPNQGYLDKVLINVRSILLSPVRNKIFGARLNHCISGGAPISIEILKFFYRLGVVILEGYGLTETTPAIGVNNLKFIKFGTIGKPFDCNIVKQGDDGELIVKGLNVSIGYFKRIVGTENSYSKDGWFQTGDITEIDDEGFIKITDRKKDILVLSTGKKVPPTLIESKFKRSLLISQVLVIGEKKNYLSALITLNRSYLLNNLNLDFDQDINEIEKLIDEEIQAVNRDLASFEQIKKFKILKDEFTVENGLLTPSLKIKRKNVTNLYQSEIDSLYSN